MRAEGGGTVLRVVESGFASVAGTEEQRAQLVERHQGGWGGFLEQLPKYAASVEVSV